MINPPAIIGSDGFIRTHAAELTIVNTIHTAKKNKVENKRKLQSKALKGFVAQGGQLVEQITEIGPACGQGVGDKTFK